MLLTALDDNTFYTLEQLADLHGLTLCEFARLLQDFTPLPRFYEDGLRGWQLKMLNFWYRDGGLLVGPEHNSYYLISVGQLEPEL